MSVQSAILSFPPLVLPPEAEALRREVRAFLGEGEAFYRYELEAFLRQLGLQATSQVYLTAPP